jgi:hypothetical protein
MRYLYLYLLLHLPGLSLAQEPSLALVQALEQRVDSFNTAVQHHAELLSTTTAIDTAAPLAQALLEGATQLLEQVEELFPPDPDLIFEMELQRNMSLSMLHTEPAVAAENQRRADQAQEQLYASMPPYYRGLKEVMALAQRLAGVKREQKVQRLGEELKEIDLSAGISSE